MVVQANPSPLLLKQQQLAEALQQRQVLKRYRRRSISDSAQSVNCTIDGKQYLAFTSNDYLGLANHPAVIKRFCDAANQWGVGSGSAHLVNGHSRLHHQLEDDLAAFTGRDRVLLFSTGYMANIGIINALLDRHDVLYQDKLNHASLLDAGLMSRASVKRFKHADTFHLQQLMSSSVNQFSIVATDGVFSMDGDIAPLDRLATIAVENNAWLLLDDAHGFGVVGKTGAGCAEHYQLDQSALPIVMGTLGKAFGVFGAFVAGSELLIETLIQQARSYVYTTAPPPAVAAAASESLRLFKTESWRRDKLNQLIEHFTRGAIELNLPLMSSRTAIQPLVAGTDERALSWSQSLKEKGLLVSAIRPPTVPEGEARLRVTLSAEHEFYHIDQLLDALSQLPELNHA